MPKFDPISALFKQLPSGPAWCCGAANEKKQSCKGVLATIEDHRTYGALVLHAPLGFVLGNGVWHRSKRQVSRFTDHGKAGREFLRKQRTLPEIQRKKEREDWELEPEEMKAWAREKEAEIGEEIIEFPAIVKCPGCQRNGIILSIEATLAQLPTEPYN